MNEPFFGLNVHTAEKHTENQNDSVGQGGPPYPEKTNQEEALDYTSMVANAPTKIMVRHYPRDMSPLLGTSRSY